MISIKDKMFLSKTIIETDDARYTYYIIKSIDCYYLAKHIVFKQTEYMLLPWGWRELNHITPLFSSMREAKRFDTFEDARLFIDFDMV